MYKKKKLLNIIKLGRGSAWLDVGSFEDLQNSYKEIFAGNHYIIKCIDDRLKEYLKNNLITQKKVLINANDLTIEITIQTNMNPSILIINIY